jgi:NDP-sugar pyrophosphorylase family protein
MPRDYYSRPTKIPQRSMFEQESEVWINGGCFIFRHEIFDYIRDGEELVLEPLIGSSLASWWRRSMRGSGARWTLLEIDRLLEEMVEEGKILWRPSAHKLTPT